MAAADKGDDRHDEDEPLLPKSAAKKTAPLTLRQRAYLLMEEPSSSTAASVVTLLIAVCIVLSVAAFCAESIPSMEKYRKMWFYLETFFVAVFTIEYLGRLWATVPDQRTLGEFVSDPFNMIDVLAIAPYYLGILMTYTMGGPHGLDLRVLRALRLLRLLKLGRYSEQATIIVVALRRSGASLVMLMFFLLFALIFFSSMIFFVERGHWDAQAGCYVRKEDGACSPFQSIPESSWWAITTMTTVGYGDVFPKSTLGRIVGAFCMIGGILSVALPTTVLGVQFSDAYDEVSAEMQAKAIRKSLPAGRGLQDELGKTLMNLEGLGAELKRLLPEINESLLKVTERSPMKRAAINAGWAPLAHANVLALGSVMEFLTSIHKATRVPDDEGQG